ncbi:MAG: DUF4292 domain-containing protein [Flavobacteriaceae bacterium]|nr:DUF4292 domain-containing protein [Flavobacteriaceae bacterium]
MRNFFLVFFIVFSGCKATKKLDSNVFIKKIPTSLLVEKTENNKTNYNYLTFRSQTSFIENGSKNQFNLSFRIKKNDRILISGSLLVPLFKGLLTKNEVLFYEKLNKSFYRGNYDYISEILNYDFTLESIENIILGKPINDLNKIRLTQKNNQTKYILKSYDRKKKLSYTYTIDPISFNLIQQKIIRDNGNYFLVNYNDFKKFEDTTFPQTIQISSLSNKKSIEIIMRNKFGKINDSISFPFKIPNGYEKIKL